MSSVDRLESLQPWMQGDGALPPTVVDWLAALPSTLSATRIAEAAALLPLLDRLEPDPPTRAAALLHPMLVADPGLKAPDGVPTALLQGQDEAEKVWSIHAEQDSKRGAEGLRRLLLSMVHDLRVVPILLARQLLRMREASKAPDDERRRLARLTADIHAPLANRLGIWQLKWELEDLAFRYLQPETYQRIAKLLDGKRRDREQFI
ncbi:MAG: HD domain-containing protein, partial [Lysobacteraceae bacterium]